MPFFTLRVIDVHHVFKGPKGMKTLVKQNILAKIARAKSFCMQKGALVFIFQLFCS